MQKITNSFFLKIFGSLAIALLLSGCPESDSDSRPKVLATYLPVGPQVDVPETTVTDGNWSICHSETYDLGTTALGTIFTNCFRGRLMLACRPVGALNFTVLAQAPRDDVAFVTPVDLTTVHNANGTGWYYRSDYSWGFAREGDVVEKDECDVDVSGVNAERLCWHTVQNPGFLGGGYRCGTTLGLNSNDTWERLVLHAD